MPTYNLSQTGLPIAVLGDSVQTATTLHQGVAGGAAGSVGFWSISAFNTTGDHVRLTIQFGAPHCAMTLVVPPSGAGATPVVAHVPLPRSATLKAHASHSNAVFLYGYWES